MTLSGSRASVAQPRQPFARTLLLCLALLLAAPVEVLAAARPGVAAQRRTRPRAAVAARRKPAPRRAIRPKRARRPAPARVARPSRAAARAPDADAVEGSAAAVVSGPAGLKALLQRAPGKVTSVGLVVDLDSGEVVFDLDAGRVVYPASVAKLFSTAAALRTLPHDRSLRTEVRAPAAVDGRVERLAIVGSGDPSLDSGDLGKLADAVRDQGIRRVDRLVVDATLFDDKLPRGFDEKHTDAAYRAPVGALQVDASTVAIAVRPGAKAGLPPVVELSPPCPDAVVVRNQARTVAARKDALSVVTRPLGRQTEVVVTGTISLRRKVVGAGRRRVADASFFAAAVFRAALERRGVDVHGPTVFAKAAADPVAAERPSRALLELVRTTNKISHNQYAETLFKLVGAAAGTPATAETSEAAVRKALEGLDIRWKGVQLGNGSGLYHSTKVTCHAVVDLVRAMAREPAGAAWKSTLAVGGVDGTLRGRLHHAATKGRIFAKTGTLDDVVGLAGYAEGPQKRYAFAFFVNGIRQGPGAYRALHDKVLRQLLGGL